MRINLSYPNPTSDGFMFPDPSPDSDMQHWVSTFREITDIKGWSSMVHQCRPSERLSMLKIVVTDQIRNERFARGRVNIRGVAWDRFGF